MKNQQHYNVYNLSYTNYVSYTLTYIKNIHVLTQFYLMHQATKSSLDKIFFTCAGIVNCWFLCHSGVVEYGTCHIYYGIIAMP